MNKIIQYLKRLFKKPKVVKQKDLVEPISYQSQKLLMKE